MFAVAPYSPANSPANEPPPPATVFTPAPPPLPELAPPPFLSPPSPSVSPATSPATSAPSTLPSTVPLPANSAPPVKSPATTAPPVLPSLSPESSLVPASSPPITSNGNPNSPSSLPSPATLLPPAPPSPPPRRTFPPSPVAPPPPFPSAKSPATGTFLVPPSSVVAPAPPTTTTLTPPAIPPVPETASPPSPAPIFPFKGAEPSSPTVSAFSPEVKSPPPSSSGSLPVAVVVEKRSGFNVSSGVFVVGIVIGAIVFVFVLAVVSVFCRNRKKKKRQNIQSHGHHYDESQSLPVGSKGSHVIRVLSNPTLPSHLTGGGGASGFVDLGSVKAIPNHVPSNKFGSVNGIFTYEELVVATNGFSEANLVGQGGFGYVYRGVLPCGKEIAVKQLKTGSQQGEREFQAEVETISRVHHKHLVELVGYCVTRAERLLVYEFVPNNTLEFHLHGEGKPVVEWATRIKIALGSAKGLAYLHEDSNPAIIHRDIKASNILLDFKFEAKVSDFGLAKIFPNTEGYITHLTTRVVGTFGYLAPEYASSGKLTDKSDVYSYGVMLLELITGRPPITAAGSRNESLVDWARPLLVLALQDGDFNNLVDPRLQKNYGADEMARMITCAAACVRHSARLRPRMSQIVGALEGLVSLTDLVGDITPGHTTLYSWSDSSNYDAGQYQQDLRNFNLALLCQKYSSSGHSESTSAYGLYLSDSSSEVEQTS